MRRAEVEAEEIAAEHDRFPILTALIGEGWELERTTKTEGGRIALRSLLAALSICMSYPPDFTEAEAEETRESFRVAVLQ
jgi:hypothetical protein